LLRKLVAVIILVPLAVAIVVFAVANRQDVVISFDPFDTAHPAYSRTTWLFVPIFAALIIGVVIGGVASWLGQGKWRGAESSPPRAGEPPAPLRLRPPA